MDRLPPRLMLRFLQWFCPEHLYEEIEGDLIERFNHDLKKYSTLSEKSKMRRARFRFILNVFRFFRPGIILRNKFSLAYPPYYMISNYMKVALRFMFRNKTYSAINLSGLALGITGAMLLFLWIAHEFSYDKFHADSDRIFKAWNRDNDSGEIKCWDVTPRILAPTLKEKYTSVESAVSFAQYSDSYVFEAGDKKITKSGVFTEPDFLKMFSFPLLQGDPSSALNSPNSIVLTERFATYLFGKKEAFGEDLTISLSGNDFQFTVTGILEDLPANTDFSFEYLLPFQFLESIGMKDPYWSNNSVSTYVKIKPNVNIDDLNKEIKDIRMKYVFTDQTEIFLYPLTKMRLYSRFENGVPAGGRIEVIRMLAILGVCLLLIACINFINLSTARAQRRSKEVAVRKVTGAYRHSLITQFLCESVVVAVMAGVISLGISYLVLPYFNSLIGQNLSLDLGNTFFWAGMLVIIVIAGILAGGYPAVYLSSFQPIRILKGIGVLNSSRSTLRSVLVVLQFGFAIMLIVSTIVIYKQVTFLQTRDAGYGKENLIYHHLIGDISKNYNSLKNELLQSGIAIGVTKTSSPVTERLSSTTDIKWRDKDPLNKTSIERFHVDENFVTTAALTLLEGRDLDLGRFPSDSSAVILNEAAVKLMGFRNPIGEKIIDNGIEYEVVGVVKDFIFTSPYRNVEPIVIQGGYGDWFNVVHIRLNPDKPVHDNIAALSDIFKKYNQDYPFEYHFVDAEYARKFSSIEKTLTLTTVFTSIAIFIACLGLLGLSTYLTEARLKEIGIRKVMGGSTMSITRLLAYSQLKPIFIAVLLFSPQAWFAMNWWLQSFAYRVSLEKWMFVVAALALSFIGIVTIGFQTIRAANTNPVKTLRNE